MFHLSLSRAVVIQGMIPQIGAMIKVFPCHIIFYHMGLIRNYVSIFKDGYHLIPIRHFDHITYERPLNLGQISDNISHCFCFRVLLLIAL